MRGRGTAVGGLVRPRRGAAVAGAADRLAVARLLAARGPTPGDEAAAALGWTADHWWEVVGRACEWFDLTGKGWRLTDAGRRVTADEGPVVCDP